MSDKTQRRRIAKYGSLAEWRLRHEAARELSDQELRQAYHRGLISERLYGVERTRRWKERQFRQGAAVGAMSAFFVLLYVVVIEVALS